MPELKLTEFSGHMKGWKTLGVPPGTCEQCATKHDPEQPHNQQSLVFQYNFYDKNGVWPKWEDAMAHCSDAVKEFWRKELKRLGVKEYQHIQP